MESRVKRKDEGGWLGGEKLDGKEGWKRVVRR